MSTGGKPVVLTSMFPALKAFSAVVPSTMIGISILVILTFFAPRHLVFLTSVSEASCFHDASLNGPSVTMWPGSVHLLPHFVTAALLTGRNEVWESCWMNQGCGDVSVTPSLYFPRALTPTLALSALQSALAGSQPLYASAPLMPKNW